MVGENPEFPFRIETWDSEGTARVALPDSAVVEAMQRMMDQIVIRGDKLEVLVANARDLSYWQNLNPELTVSPHETTAGIEGVCIQSEQKTRALHHLRSHGYFILPPICSPEVIERMRSCVETLRRAGWPAVFSYLYDEFWAPFQNAAVIDFIRNYLGDYKITANIWAHFVEPRNSASGWPPHVDSGMRERLTAWIPLTDASIDNGCMYVIPQDLVPQTLPKNYLDWQRIDKAELGPLLHGVRPLPAYAGSIMGWHHALIHWGGRATNSANVPRISLAIEFISDAATPDEAELPTNSPGIVPDFSTKLELIAKSILKYKNFETPLVRYNDFATRLVELTRATWA